MSEMIPVQKAWGIGNNYGVDEAVATLLERNNLFDQTYTTLSNLKKLGDRYEIRISKDKVSLADLDYGGNTIDDIEIKK